MRVSLPMVVVAFSRVTATATEKAYSTHSVGRVGRNSQSSSGWATLVLAWAAVATSALVSALDLTRAVPPALIHDSPAKVTLDVASAWPYPTTTMVWVWFTAWVIVALIATASNEASA